MQKFILFFILSLLFVVFGVFLFNSYILQKNYFSKKTIPEATTISSSTEEVIIPSQYLPYSKENYDTAIIAKRPLVLFFTSNWCSLCADQDAVNKTLFEGLTKEGVTGLKIHILDSETTTETDAIARKFDVTKENSIVVLDKMGAVVLKHTGNMAADLLKTKILEVR